MRQHRSCVVTIEFGRPPKSDADDIKHPPHYTDYSIEPVTFIMANELSFWRGNIVKYALRAGKKRYPDEKHGGFLDAVDSEIKDLEKVRRYAEMRIRELRGEDIL